MTHLFTINEIWANIPECDGTYQVSNLGNIKSLARWVIGGNGKRQYVPERLLKPVRDTDGYYVVTIRPHNKKSRLMKVHRLVLLAFQGPSNLMCCHSDGNRQNNCLENLRYGTAQDNADDRASHGQQVGAKGEKNGAAKLTEADVLRIKEYLAEANLSKSHIAKLFNVAIETIRSIAIGRTWRHV